MAACAVFMLCSIISLEALAADRIDHHFKSGRVRQQPGVRDGDGSRDISTSPFFAREKHAHELCLLIMCGMCVGAELSTHGAARHSH